MAYRVKTEADLVFEDNKDFVRSQVRLVMKKLERRLLNSTMAEMDRHYSEGLAKGELRELGISIDEVQQLIADQANQLILEG